MYYCYLLFMLVLMLFLLINSTAVSASSLISNKQVQLETRPVTQNYPEILSTDVGVSHAILDRANANPQVNGPVQGSTIEASVGSVVDNIFTKFPTSLKLRNSSVLLLVATLAVILILMQVSSHFWNFTPCILIF